LKKAGSKFSFFLITGLMIYLTAREAGELAGDLSAQHGFQR
jgi:hypothetical protein